MTSVMAIGWPTPYGGRLRQSTLHYYMIHLIIDLEQINNVIDKWRISALLVEILEVSR